MKVKVSMILKKDKNRQKISLLLLIYQPNLIDC